MSAELFLILAILSRLDQAQAPPDAMRETQSNWVFDANGRLDEASLRTKVYERRSFAGRRYRVLIEKDGRKLGMDETAWVLDEVSSSAKPGPQILSHTFTLTFDKEFVLEAHPMDQAGRRQTLRFDTPTMALRERSVFFDCESGGMLEGSRITSRYEAGLLREVEVDFYTRLADGGVRHGLQVTSYDAIASPRDRISENRCAHSSCFSPSLP